MFGERGERRLPPCSRTPTRGVTCNRHATSQRGPDAGAPAIARPPSSDGSCSSSWPSWPARTSARRPSRTEQSGVGDSGQAAKIVKDSYPDRIDEAVLIQSKTLKTGDPQYRAVVSDVTKRLRETKGVRSITSPYAEGKQLAPVSDDGHSTMIGFEINGATEDAAPMKIVDCHGRRHQGGPAGAPRLQRRAVRLGQLRGRLHADLQRRSSEGHIHLAADHADPARAGVRNAGGGGNSAPAGDHRRPGHDGRRRPHSASCRRSRKRSTT